MLLDIQPEPKIGLGVINVEGDGEHQELCRLLNRLTPGLLPREVFHAIARVMVTTTFVVVPLVQRRGRTLALLPRRSSNDLYYPSMLNVPGTIIRANDEDLAAVYERLVQAEIPGVSAKQAPVFVDKVYDLIVRGREISLIHWVEVDDADDLGDFVDVRNLPTDVVPTDRSRIMIAVDHFEKHKAEAGSL
ncbi:hypothetical protein [Microvirga terrestris]|uniref:NUDIX hydrolase n=1 Tax=Microvirga terrestris TaxID=2791024 RepID=A0ABS0HX75_9HYPH|nr:hypothetical protein [Microvirga terrestris]MBF9198103.1 hypothetical protein [Microvirga terrestris]